MKPNGTGIGQKARATFITALLLPYLLLQSVAAGVMPVSEDGGLAFSLCLGNRVIEARIQADGSYLPDDNTSDTAHDDGCPWAVVHVLAALPAASRVSQPSTLSQPLRVTIFAASKPFSVATRLPPVRAPPISV